MINPEIIKNAALEKSGIALERFRALGSRQKIIVVAIFAVFCVVAFFVSGKEPKAMTTDYQAQNENVKEEAVQNTEAGGQNSANFADRFSALSGQALSAGHFLEKVFVAEIAKSRTIKVPGDFAKIQEAIDSAKSGDVIMVAAGEYKENLIMKDGVSVIGSGAENTIIDGQKIGNVIAFKNVADTRTRLEKLTIKNSGENLGGVFIEDSSPIISRNVILDNDYDVYIKGNSSPTVQRNKLSAGKAGVQVFNLEYVANYKPIIIDNVIFRNKKGVNVYNGEVLIEHNTISFNSYYKDDLGATFGIYLAGAGGNIKNNIITDNGTCELCSGIYVDEKSKNVTIGFNNLWNNKNNFVCFGECTMESSNLSDDPEFESEENFSLSDKSKFLKSASDGQRLGSRL